MATVNPVREQLSHITVDYDQQGRLILDNQGKKYEITLESNDGLGHTTPLALQKNGATTNKIKALIAGLFQAHVVHDQENSDVQRMDRQGLHYTNSTLKNHDFLIWDKNAHDPSRNAATKELVNAMAPHLEGPYVDELVKAQTVWDRLENLVMPTPALTLNTSSPSSTSSNTTPTGTSTSAPLTSQPQTTQLPVADPMRRINTSGSLTAPLSPTSPNTNPFDEPDDQVDVDLILDIPSSLPASPLPSPLPAHKTEKHVHFAPSAHGHSAMKRVEDTYHPYTSAKKSKQDHSALERVRNSFHPKYTPPKKKKPLSIQQQVTNLNK
jgi:hypothetical protein